MPGSAREVNNAEEEGVDFQWLTNPKEFIGKNSNVSEVVVTKMKLGETDATGRQKPEIISGSEVKIKAGIPYKLIFTPKVPLSNTAGLFFFVLADAVDATGKKIELVVD